ncbi:limbic system-associated membrane protein-like [Crassostrea angulata]|uniref:limbic system-associated membrane protein-like n=1 Tax=Magallana angulata TaxID=2784310 RepID=UPI0022B13C12|nr:limbic system-associated membrane protein-like [Crassostrea angulata]
MYALFCILAFFSVIDAKPEVVTYDLGEDLIYPLYCRVDDIRRTSWKRDDNLITFGKMVFKDKDRISIDSSRPLEYNLKMTQMSKNDEGNYSCTAGEKTFGSYFLKAKESASIPTVISNITSMVGETVLLWCNATGYPEPTVTWYAYQQTESGEKLKNIGISGNMLGIRNISRNCNTIYQCQAINSYRMKKPVAKNITLRVDFFPDVFVHNEINGNEISNGGSILGRKQDSVVLSCSVYAVPPPNVTWSRDNITIGTYHHVNGAIEKSQNNNTFLYELKTEPLQIKTGISLTLDFQLDADYTFASYHCDAENEVGSNRKTVKIKHVQKR